MIAATAAAAAAIANLSPTSMTGDKDEALSSLSASDGNDKRVGPQGEKEEEEEEVVVAMSTAHERILARVPDSVELPNFRTFGLLDVRPEPFVPPPFGVTFLGELFPFGSLR